MEGLLLVGLMGGTVGLLGLGAWANRAEEAKPEESVEERIRKLAQGDYGDTETKPKMLREKALEKSFNERVLFPLAQQVSDTMQGILPLGADSWVRAKLMQAGYTKPHLPKVFLGIQLLCTTLIVGFILTITLFFGQMPLMASLIFAGIFGAAGYGLPILWLIQQAQKRQQDIQKSLPDFIDLLVICMEAGLGLDVAIQKICNLKSVKTSTYLRQELKRYSSDLGFGKPRKQAMRDLADRIGLDDLTTVINSLIQAYEMGTGIAHTLRVQSESLRVKRLQQAEEKANKVPVKMVIPIYIFLFPAIFVSMFGPIGVIMIKSVLKIFSQMSAIS